MAIYDEAPQLGRYISSIGSLFSNPSVRGRLALEARVRPRTHVEGQLLEPALQRASASPGPGGKSCRLPQDSFLM